MDWTTGWPLLVIGFQFAVTAAVLLGERAHPATRALVAAFLLVLTVRTGGGWVVTGSVMDPWSTAAPWAASWLLIGLIVSRRSQALALAVAFGAIAAHIAVTTAAHPPLRTAWIAGATMVSPVVAAWLAGRQPWARWMALGLLAPLAYWSMVLRTDAGLGVGGPAGRTLIGLAAGALGIVVLARLLRAAPGPSIPIVLAASFMAPALALSQLTVVMDGEIQPPDPAAVTAIGVAIEAAAASFFVVAFGGPGLRRVAAWSLVASLGAWLALTGTAGSTGGRAAAAGMTLLLVLAGAVHWKHHSRLGGARLVGRFLVGRAMTDGFRPICSAWDLTRLRRVTVQEVDGEAVERIAAFIRRRAAQPGPQRRLVHTRSGPMLVGPAAQRTLLSAAVSGRLSQDSASAWLKNVHADLRAWHAVAGCHGGVQPAAVVVGRSGAMLTLPGNTGDQTQLAGDILRVRSEPDEAAADWRDAGLLDDLLAPRTPFGRPGSTSQPDCQRVG